MSELSLTDGFPVTVARLPCLERPDI